MDNKIKVGDVVIMPEPELPDDAWHFGGFCGTVVKIINDGLCIVEDMDGDGFTVETDRLELEG